MTMPATEVPRVSDPEKEPEKVRRHTETVANILNSLFLSGQLVRNGPASFMISGSGGGGGSDPISSVYPVFTPSGGSDEFSGASFSGWTAVNSGSHLPTLTQNNNVLSINHPGGDGAAQLHAWVKPVTIGAGNFVECAYRQIGVAQNYNIAGVIMSDGTTYAAGKQVIFYYSPNETKWALLQTTGFNNQVDFNGSGTIQGGLFANDVFLRLTMTAANTFSGQVSCDGQSWLTLLSGIAETITPTNAGFFVTTWGGSSPFLWTYRYCKFG